MRFLQLKKDRYCYHCGSTMFAGEEAVLIRIKHTNGITITQFFHTDTCYEEWNKESYVNRLFAWRQGTVPLKKKPKRGRPRKYKNIFKANRIQSLICYHRKAGNVDRILELESHLEGLKS